VVDSNRGGSDVPSWPRPYFRGPGGTPFLFYVVYGKAAQPLRLSRARYRCTGVAPTLDLMEYGPDRHPEIVASFLHGHLWDHLKQASPALAGYVAAQSHCTILRGTYPDARTLDEFRNAVGLLTCLVDAGCGAIFDAQMFRWWSGEEWKREIFEPAAPIPRAHVTVLWSDEPDGGGGRWLHTRGMRKFGRPDISLRGVPPERHDAALDLCNRFIELQALGGVVQEGEEIRLAGLPGGMRCHHAGDLEDPEFNNVRLEIHWPGQTGPA
jgi:hypothetical protein